MALLEKKTNDLADDSITFRNRSRSLRYKYCRQLYKQKIVMIFIAVVKSFYLFIYKFYLFIHAMFFFVFIVCNLCIKCNDMWMEMGVMFKMN